MTKKELLRLLRSMALSEFTLRCRICYRSISSKTPEAVAKHAAEQGWEVTVYDPKVHIKIARAKAGDLVATCFNHSSSAIWL